MMMLGTNSEERSVHDQGQSSDAKNNNKSKYRVAYETSPPYLAAMAAGCVAALLATILGCSYMCPTCLPCVTCRDGKGLDLLPHQVRVLQGHEALIHRLMEYPDLLLEAENQKLILQLTRKQLDIIHKKYCFYFMTVPTEIWRDIGVYEQIEGQPSEASLFYPKTGISDVNSTQARSSLPLKRDRREQLNQGDDGAKDNQVGDNDDDNDDEEDAKVRSSPHRRLKRHDQSNQDDDEAEDRADDNDNDNSHGEGIMCSSRTIQHPVVLYKNAAGELIQLIQDEFFYQPVVNERCSQEFSSSTHGGLTVTCVTTHRLAQAYALNLVTHRFGLEKIRITRCSPVLFDKL